MEKKISSISIVKIVQRWTALSISFQYPSILCLHLFVFYVIRFYLILIRNILKLIMTSK